LAGLVPNRDISRLDRSFGDQHNVLEGLLIKDNWERGKS
jgi:hypothetical protein